MGQVHLITDAAGNAINFATATQSFSAFGEQLTAQLSPIVNLYWPYGLISSGLVTHSGILGGSITAESGLVKLSTGAASGGHYHFDSRAPIRYIPGQGVNVRFTAAFTSGAGDNGRQWIGVGDDEGAFLFGMSGTQFGIRHVERQGVETFIPESTWNGTNGPTINHELGNIYNIQYQWLGYGDIRFNIEDPEDGRLKLVHTIRYANTKITPSIANPTMRLHAQVNNGEDAEELLLRTASMGAFHEGPEVKQGFNFAASGQRSISNDTLHNILSIKVNETHGGIENHSSIKPLLISLDNDGSQDCAFKIIAGGAGITGSFTDVATNQSYVSTNKDDDDPGETAANMKSEFILAKNSSLTLDVSPFVQSFHPGQYITIAAQRLGNATIVATCSFLWREEY
jgi:hypothetical protein